MKPTRDGIQYASLWTFRCAGEAGWLLEGDPDAYVSYVRMKFGSLWGVPTGWMAERGRFYAGSARLA